MQNYHMVVSDLRKVERWTVIVGVGDVNHGITRRTGTGNSIGRIEARSACRFTWTQGNMYQMTLHVGTTSRIRWIDMVIVAVIVAFSKIG